jgi:hypothetical protein
LLRHLHSRCVYGIERFALKRKHVPPKRYKP